MNLNIFTQNVILGSSNGVFFGLFIGLYFYYLGMKRSIIRLLLFSFISGLGLFLAVQACVFIINPIPGSNTNMFMSYLAFMCAGYTGSLLLSLGFHFLYSPLKLYQFVINILLGGLLSFTIFISIPTITLFFQSLESPINGAISSAGFLDSGWFFLFIIWQVGIAIALALEASESKRVSLDS